MGKRPIPRGSRRGHRGIRLPVSAPISLPAATAGGGKPPRWFDPPPVMRAVPAPHRPGRRPGPPRRPQAAASGAGRGEVAEAGRLHGSLAVPICPYGRPAKVLNLAGDRDLRATPRPRPRGLPFCHRDTVGWKKEPGAGFDNHPGAVTHRTVGVSSPSWVTFRAASTTSSGGCGKLAEEG